MQRRKDAKMHRFLKYKFLLFVFLLCCFNTNSAFGASAPITEPPLPASIKPISSLSAPTALSPVQPQTVNFSICNKTFKMNDQKLFFLALASINANRFRIDEIKSNGGYVLFTAAHRQFLATVVEINSQICMLKIVPCDNVYVFPVGIVQNMFKYIELNMSTKVESLSIL